MLVRLAGETRSGQDLRKYITSIMILHFVNRHGFSEETRMLFRSQ